MEASAERWLQLAEMVLDGEESKALWSGEMEKSCCGCEETPLGLLRMLITCRHRGGAAVNISTGSSVQHYRARKNSGQSFCLLELTGRHCSITLTGSDNTPHFLHCPQSKLYISATHQEALRAAKCSLCLYCGMLIIISYVLSRGVAQETVRQVGNKATVKLTDKKKQVSHTSCFSCQLLDQCFHS